MLELKNMSFRNILPFWLPKWSLIPGFRCPCTARAAWSPPGGVPPMAAPPPPPRPGSRTFPPTSVARASSPSSNSPRLPEPLRLPDPQTFRPQDPQTPRPPDPQNLRTWDPQNPQILIPPDPPRPSDSQNPQIPDPQDSQIPRAPDPQTFRPQEPRTLRLPEPQSLRVSGCRVCHSAVRQVTFPHHVHLGCLYSFKVFNLEELLVMGISGVPRSGFSELLNLASAALKDRGS